MFLLPSPLGGEGSGVRGFGFRQRKAPSPPAPLPQGERGGRAGTAMTIVRCLYCDAENDAAATSGYCDGCGHKLPPASLARRRRLYAAGPGAAEEEDRPRPARQAANLLFSVAVLQVVAGGLLLILGPLAAEQVTADFLPRVITGSVVLLLLFAGLGWWALRRPFPAAVAGLVVFVLLA